MNKINRLNKLNMTQVISLLKTLIESVRLHQEQEAPKFRLIAVDKKQGKVKVQLIGSAKMFYADAKELISSELLMAFSKKDAVMITHWGTKLLSASVKKKTLKYRFRRLLPALCGGRSFIEVENSRGDFEKRPCFEVLEDVQLVATATDQQKVKVGYIAGYEACKEKRHHI